jgi:HD-GYP domain-containing protein (c-di-GMP phosphodiesterase class II)
MKIDLLGMLSSFSRALDGFYEEMSGKKIPSSQSIALTAVYMGKNEGFSKEQLFDLAALALLENSGWTQVFSEPSNKSNNEKLLDLEERHCFLAEENASAVPFKTSVWKSSLHFMDEREDGKGYFHRRGTGIPLYARFLHLAKGAGEIYLASSQGRDGFDDVIFHLKDGIGTIYNDDDVDIFYSSFNSRSYRNLFKGDLTDQLNKEVGVGCQELSFEAVKKIALLYAYIVDCKSSFTRFHSSGTAQKAFTIAKALGYSIEESYNLGFAGALHDFGLMLVPNSILEKPSKLSDHEYAIMQKHVSFSSEMLCKVAGLEKVLEISAAHHERLDGSGYPGHKVQNQLNQEQCLLACLDVYQALREDRPYRKAMSHETAIALMREMANDRKLDEDLINKLSTFLA